MTAFGPPVPILRSFDAAQARAFYLDFLGFALMFEHRFQPDLPLYMGVCHGECVIHLSEHYGDATPGAALRIPVDDVDAYAAGLRAKTFEHARPGEPRLTPWWTREVTVRDPASNALTFFTPMESDNGAR